MSAYTNRPGDPTSALVIPLGTGDGLKQAEQEQESITAALQQIENAVTLSRSSQKRLADRFRALALHSDQLRGERESVRGELAQAKTACEKAAQRSESLERELGEIRQRYAQLRESAQGKVNALIAREEKFKTAVLAERESKRSLEVQLASRDSDLSFYKNSWPKMMRIKQEAQVSSEQNSILQRAIKEINLKNHILSADSAAKLDAARSEKEGLEKKISQLETQLEKLQTGSAATARVHEKEKAALLIELQQVGMNAKLAQAEIDTSKKRISQLESQVVALHASLEAATRDNEQAKKDAKTSQAEFEKTWIEFEVTAREHEREKAALLRDLQQARGETKASSAELGAKLDAAREEVTTLGKKAAQLEAHVFEVRVEALTDEFEKTTQERIKLQEERDALQVQLAQAIEEKNRQQRSYPLRDLLSHKESEVNRAAHELSGLSPDHPARKQAENILGTLIDQRDQLKHLLLNR